MADATTIIKGRMEDHLGRILRPDTDADQVLFSDGNNAETKVQALINMLAGYVPKNGSSTINGSLETNNGHISADQWLAISSGSDGHALFAQNAYKDYNANTYHYLRTHESMGARGIIFRHGSPGIYWFDTGMVATTKDTAFTPTFRRLDAPDGELISGQDLNALTQNGVYCGQQVTNAPDSDWWYIWVQNLSGNSTSYVFQLVSGVNSMSMYFRIRLNGNWLGWARLLTSGDGIPTQHYSTSPPSNADGQDGDTWDVYV